MTDSEIRQKVRNFKKDYVLKELTYSTLSEAVEKQGYTIIEFNNISNDENVQNLIDALKLNQNIVHSKGFTYANTNYRIVFINESLSDEEKLIVLSHEQGHIYLGHLATVSIIGRDVIEEYEANEFSHYLLNPVNTSKALLAVKTHKKAAIAAFLSLVLIIGAVCAICIVHSKNVYYGEYYITPSGTKYHTKDCSFVSDKKNLRRLTKEEYESGKYEPCQKCVD